MNKKEIKIVDGKTSDKVYRSHREVALDLSTGEEVTVAVREDCGGVMVLAGYAKVKMRITTYEIEEMGNEY